jgi:CrcB protein
MNGCGPSGNRAGCRFFERKQELQKSSAKRKSNRNFMCSNDANLRRIAHKSKARFMQACGKTVILAAMLQSLLLVFLGGGIGSLLRFGVSAAVRTATSETVFPYATLLSNLLSCLIMGLTISIFADRLIAQPSLRLFVLVGICGGFSTFSTFSFETLDLFRSGHAYIAIANILLSVSLCILLLFLLVKKTP